MGISGWGDEQRNDRGKEVYQGFSFFVIKISV